MALARDQATRHKRADRHERRPRRYVVVVRGMPPANVIDAVSLVHALVIQARGDVPPQMPLASSLCV